MRGRGRKIEDHGAAARRLHSAWLTWALDQPEGVIPRIPTRRVAQGGFTDLMRTHRGRRAADSWWARAIETISRLAAAAGIDL